MTPRRVTIILVMNNQLYIADIQFLGMSYRIISADVERAGR